jgi:hypothetical protein
VTQAARFVLREHDNLPRALREPLEHALPHVDLDRPAEASHRP